MDDNWVDVAAVDLVPKGDVVAVIVSDKEVALYEVNGEIFATENLCSHGAGRMSDGFLLDNEIECPLHQGRFDVCTGKALCEPLTEDIRTYPVKIKEQRIFLKFG